MKTLNILSLRIDGGTQSRVEINNEVVADYAEAIKVGIEFPPVVAFFDGTDNWLADGFHRYHSHKHAGKASIAADVREGTVRDAILFSLGANAAHGLRRTNADKRKAAETMLADAEWAAWSDREIARRVDVSHELVRQIRAAICQRLTDSQSAAGSSEAPHLVEKQDAVRTVQRGGTTYKQDTSRVGKAPPAPAPRATSKPARTLTPPPPDDIGEETDADRLNEALDTVNALVDENTVLRDRLAVEAIDASEEEKTQAAETIRQLRARVVTLEAELDAVKVSRDTFMRENGQMKNQLASQRRELEKARKATA